MANHRRLVLITTLSLSILIPFFSGKIFAQSNKKKVVALLPFTSPTQYNILGRNAESAFVTALVKTRQMKVIQASIVKRMMKRKGLHYTGTVEPALLKAAGRWLKADLLLSGNLRYTGDGYTLSVNATNINTLETTLAEDVDFPNSRKMKQAIRLMARKIAGQISGRGHAAKSSDLFVNTNAKAFYRTADICLGALNYRLGRHRFSGKIAAADESKKTITISGYGVHRLRPGLPINIIDSSSLDEGENKVVTAYIEKIKGGKAIATYKMAPSNGIPLDGLATNRNHRWAIAVGLIVDEVENNKALTKKFRQTLLEKMSEGTAFQEVESSINDQLAKQSHRHKRFFAYRKLFNRGIEFVLEGKFYGTSGNRRADFKLYSTKTGKVFDQIKFDTRL